MRLPERFPEDVLGDAIHHSDQIIKAYNQKEFAKLKALLHPAIDFAHVNRGYSFNKSGDLIDVLEAFAFRVMPDRHWKDPERVVSQGDVAVRVAEWGGTARTDIPGFGKAGEKITITISSVMRFDSNDLLCEWKDYG